MNLKIFLENIKTILEILAISIAGLWAYYKFLRGRLFHHKIDVELDGEFVLSKEGYQILVSISVKNLGFTRLIFDPECSVLQVFAAQTRPNLDFTDAQIWRRLATIPILQEHQMIEPAEVIRDKELISLNSNLDMPVRLITYISDSKNIWKATTVVPVRNSNQI